MSGRGRFGAALVAFAMLGIGDGLFRTSPRDAVTVEQPDQSHDETGPLAVAPVAEMARPLADFAADPVVGGLNDPNGSVERDIEIAARVFQTWQTNFPADGNPVGENREITAALTGRNRLGLVLISPEFPAINAAGEWCDRWGTPWFFHQVSGRQMELRSAGPDREFYTADDVMGGL